MDDDFWKWSLDIYAREGVEAALMPLQDELGLDINVILWCVWCGASGRGAPPESALRRAIEISKSWTDRVTSPLRAARRAAKTAPPGADKGEADSMRLKIKEAELLSEKFVQKLLAGIPGVERGAGTGDPQANARKNLVRYAALSGAARKPGFSAAPLLTAVEKIFSEIPYNDDQRKDD
ncbi:MAG: hypothetical protein Tsb0010_00500 [Parvularculaceae bacterium]